MVLTCINWNNSSRPICLKVALKCTRNDAQTYDIYICESKTKENVRIASFDLKKQ